MEGMFFLFCFFSVSVQVSQSGRKLKGRGIMVSSDRVCVDIHVYVHEVVL